jgi:hypothetical protein
MVHSLLIGDDQNVANWAFAAFRKVPFQYNRAYGLLDEEKKLDGAVLFHNCNGANLELSYYGANTMSVGIFRTLAKLAIAEFNPSRCTVVVSKRNKRLMKSLHRCGWKLEGVQRRYYGHLDVNRNAGVRFVLFQEQIERMAIRSTFSSELAQQG